MYLTEEDKTQYNLIEDKFKSRIIGRKEDIVKYINDNIEYNIKNTDDEDSVQQLKDVISSMQNVEDDEVIAIFENVMIGLDWLVLD